MCRWLGYYGNPINPKELLYDPEHSLIEQSRLAAPDVPTANADGHGLGWYSEAGRPTLFRSAAPAWGDENLRELSATVRSSLFLAHVRAATGTPVQQTNCHPFRYGRWMFVHNGFIADFQRLRRDLILAVRPDLFESIGGSTDSEVMFYLALTFGLDQDVPGAVARMAGLIERVGRDQGVEYPLQMTVAVSDGERLWSFRYSSLGKSRSLFYSGKAETVRALHPDSDFLRGVSDSTRLVVSEPLGGLPGVWKEVPESSYGVVQPGTDAFLPFAPEPV